MKKKQNFLTGAAILAAGVAIVKLIGFLNKIPLVNILGGAGFGHYTNAYNIYSLLLVISTQGLPVAVSKLVAEANERGRAREIKKIVRIAMSIFFGVGGIGSLGMFIFAPQLADLYASPDSVYAIRAIAPSVFFLTVISAIRGYYQGLSNMYPTAISQIIEALGKLVLGVSFALYLSDKGYPIEICAAGAIFGVISLKIINNCINLMNVPYYWGGAVLGIIILLAIIFENVKNRKL
jgi:stage V sporulation protein B